MKKYFILCLSVVFLLTGCAQKSWPTPFLWGNYSESLYNYKENPGQESLAKHLRTLERIIEQAEEREQLQVPPGVHAEYGYYLLQDNETEKALNHLEREKELYPESEVFINRIIERVHDQS